jgi:hypothetical protein
MWVDGTIEPYLRIIQVNGEETTRNLLAMFSIKPQVPSFLFI